MDRLLFEAQLREQERSLDQRVTPGVWIIARLDGRGFTEQLHKKLNFNAPHDPRFRDLMLATTHHLMGQCGFRVLFGHSQSDEISLLFHRNEDAFARRTSKFNSLLAAEASVFLSRQLDHSLVFDCKTIPMPDPQSIVDYFRWRSEEAFRNALNAHCYWELRRQNFSPRQSDEKLRGQSHKQKIDLLNSFGIDFVALPQWQKRGCGLRWRSQTHQGWNPKTQKIEYGKRRQLEKVLILPEGEEYQDWLFSLLQK